MNSLEDDNCPEKSEPPYIVNVVEESGLDEIVGSNEPVEGREGRRFVVFRDWGSGNGRGGHRSER